MEPPTMIKMDRYKRIQGATLMIGEKEYPIFKGVNTIGRNKIATVNIKHLNVSQNQAIIVAVDDTQHFLSDMNSSNGTYLYNNKLVPFKLYELSDKVEIKFGDVAGVYSKISGTNSTLRLQTTMNESEMTQNMTQNFYASNTQLIFDNRNITDHSYSNADATNKTLYNIHEEPTQVVNNPFLLPKTQDLIYNENTQIQIQEVIIEEPVDDIHEATTQVVICKDAIEKQSMSQGSSHSVYNKEFHEAPTQEICFPESNGKQSESQHSSSTQIINEQQTENLIERINARNNETSATQTMTSQENHELIDRIKKKNLLDKTNNQVDVVDSLSPEINIKDKEKVLTEANVTDAVFTPLKKSNVVHNSQNPSTSKSGLLNEYDDSFMGFSKSIKPSVLEEIIIENSDSNESVDFLNMAEVSNVNIENTQSSTISESEIIRRPKIPLQLPDSQLSQSSACSFDIIPKRKKTVPIPSTQNSDVETDIENTQEIGFKKRPAKPIDSDSETDMDETQENKLQGNSKIIHSDSETDCEDIPENLEPKTASIENKSNENAHVVSDKNEFEDSDCIPATQDAFAEALGYRALKDQKTQQSSEESFKLGLTELMDDTVVEEKSNESTDNKEKDEEPDDTIGKPNETDNVDENDKLTNISKDDLYLLPTQKIQENNSKKFTFKKKLVELDGSLTTILSNKKDKMETAANDNDLYMMPTQKLVEQSKKQKSDETIDDIFLQPTQKIVTPSKNKMLSQKLYSDDVFVQPTQKMDSEGFAIPADKDDVYFQPTQCFRLSGSSKTQNIEDDDVYAAATQVFLKDVPKEIAEIPSTQEDVYNQPTQKLDADDTHVQNEDVYDLATQVIKISNPETDKGQVEVNSAANIPDTDTQLEMPFTSQTTNFVVTESTNRPGNPIIQELNNLSPENNEINSETIATGDSVSSESTVFKEPMSNKRSPARKQTDGETISQIEDFIQKPLPPTIRKSARKSDLKKVEERPETLSQIVEFIEKPLTVNIANNSNLIQKKMEKEKDKTETLSQISAFVNKPLSKNGEPNKDNKSKEPERVAIRVSKRKTIVADSTIIEGNFVEEDQELKQDTLREDDFDKTESSRELKSDVDQSFALLESMNTKVKRNLRRDPVLDEIKVTLTSHRRSMNIAENKNKDKTKTADPKKSKRSVTTNNVSDNSDDSELEETSKVTKTRQQRASSVSSEPEKRVSTRRKKTDLAKINEETDDNVEVAAKTRERKSKKPSASGELKIVSTSVKTNKTDHKASSSDDSDLEETSKVPQTSRKQRASSVSSEPEKRVSTRRKKTDQTKINEDTEPTKLVKTVAPSYSANTEDTTKTRESKSMKSSIIPTIPTRGKKVQDSKMAELSEENEDKSRTTKKPSRKQIMDSINDRNEDAHVNRASKKHVKDSSKEEESRINKEPEECNGNRVDESEGKRASKKKMEILSADSKDKKQTETVQRSSKRQQSEVSEDAPSTHGKRGRTGLNSSSESELPPLATRGGKTKIIDSGKESSASSDFVPSDLRRTPLKRVGKTTIIDSDKESSGSSDFAASDLRTPAKRGGKTTIIDTDRESNASSDFAPSELPTPSKRGRITSKSSTSGDTRVTPRKGRDAPKVESLLSSAERSKRKQKPKVVFTMLDSPQLESFIKHLGGSIVDSVDSSTVLVTQCVKRSQKLLTAVAQAKPICSPEWIKSSKKSNEFLDPWDYLLIDKEAEKKWGFSLKESLLRAGQNKLLEGYIFQIMVTNALDVLKGSIEACGGKLVTKPPGSSELDKFLIIATPEQKSKFQRIKKLHPDVRVIEPEAIFDGVLRQEFRISRHLLT